MSLAAPNSKKHAARSGQFKILSFQFPVYNLSPSQPRRIKIRSALTFEARQERLRGLFGPRQFSRMVKRQADITKNTAQKAPKHTKSFGETGVIQVFHKSSILGACFSLLSTPPHGDAVTSSSHPEHGSRWPGSFTRRIVTLHSALRQTLLSVDQRPPITQPDKRISIVLHRLFLVCGSPGAPLDNIKYYRSARSNRWTWWWSPIFCLPS